MYFLNGKFTYNLANYGNTCAIFLEKQVAKTVCHLNIRDQDKYSVPGICYSASLIPMP